MSDSANRWSYTLAVLLGMAGCVLEDAEPTDDIALQDHSVQTMNALTSNALTSNALTSNALTSNALTSNALTSNALTSNALTSNGITILTTDPQHPKNVLRTNGAARMLLKYAYECAMPPSSSLPLVIDGVDFGTITGSLNLAPEWGVAGGSCNETCQRWVSACLLARVNPYGTPVQISLRGFHPALGSGWVDPAEIPAYPWADGGFFGNVFSGGGPMYACGDNYFLAQYVSRTCGRGEAGCPMTNLGACLPYVCDSAPSNVLTTCYDGGGAAWPEVITVFVKDVEVGIPYGPYLLPACDGWDNDMDGTADDGFGTGAACDGPDEDFCKDGVLLCRGDALGTTCSDDGASWTEACNGADDDCDGAIDEGLAALTFYVDADGDGHGSSGATMQACALPAGYSASATDCNDLSGAVRPGATDVCGNGVDEDCSGADAVCPPPPPPSAALPLYQPLATGTLYTNVAWNYNMGYSFHTTQAVTVSALGGRFTGTKTVRLYDRATNAVIAQVNVTAAGAWTYAAITPVTLLANHDYSVAVWLAGSGGSYYSGAALPKTATGITNITTCYRYGSTAEPCSSSGALAGGYMYGVADLEYTPSTATPPPAPGSSLVFTATASATADANKYIYWKFAATARTFQSGDFVEYDVRIDQNVAGVGGLDIYNTDGSYFRDTAGWVDQNGVPGHPAANLAASAYGVWAHRRLAVPAAMVGRTSAYWVLAAEHDGAGVTTSAHIGNVVVTNGGAVVAAVYQTGAPPVNVELFRAAYATASLAQDAAASTCAHATTVTGAALANGCSTCVTLICAADPYCCTTAWDSICVGETSMCSP